jgi:HAD superfamily hydrolase (TIGR01509 family)
MVKAVIFDMDGVMVDTEPLQNRAFSWLVERENKKPVLFSNGLIHKVGITERENVEFLKKKYSLRGEVDMLVEERAQYYRKVLKERIKPTKGLLSLVATLISQGIRLGIASSSARQNITFVIKKLGLEDSFLAIVSGEEIDRGKPYPDIYLEAARRLQVLPAECVVIEDSSSGVLAGSRAGMKVIAVPNIYTRGGDFSLAYRVENSLETIVLS